MRLTRTMTVFLVMLLSFSCLTGKHTRMVKAEEKNPLKIEKIIGLSKEPGTFRKAQGLAVAKDGTIFIGDTGESQIEVYDANNKYVKTIGSLGTGEDQFQYIQNTLLDEDENLYVLDSFFNRIQVFNKDGTFIRKFGETGDAMNEFYWVQDFVFLKTGELLIIDINNHSKVFSKEGKFLREFISEKKYQSDRYYPDTVTVDTFGNVYICTFDINDLEYKYLKFNQFGKFLCNFIEHGTDEKDIFSNIGCMTTKDTYFYLTDANTVKKYKIHEDPKEPLVFMETFINNPSKNIEKTTVLVPSALICSNQKIYYLDSSLNRLLILSDSKEILGTIQSTIMEYGKYYPKNEIPKDILSRPRGIVIGPENNFYVANVNFNKISIFDSNWKEINSIGRPLEKSKKVLGELGSPVDIVFDELGNMFVTDIENNNSSLEVYTKDLVPLHSFFMAKGAPGGLGINSSGNLIIANEPVGLEVYDISKVAEKKIIKKKTFPIEGSGLVDLLIDERDNMIVSVFYTSEIQWINSNGKMIQKVGDLQAKEIPLHRPRGLCQDGAGNIYVAEPSPGRIQKFDPNGNLIWKSELDWNGLSFMTMDSLGKLYVTDMQHNVVLVIKDETAVPPTPKVPTGNESNASFTFTVEKKEVTEQDIFTLLVKVNKLEYSSSIDMAIQYPDALLQVESIGLGDILKSQSFDNPSTLKKPGTIQIKSSSRDRTEASGSGVLFELKLKAMKPGLADFDFGEITLHNKKGENVSYAEKTALSVVIRPRVPTPPPLTMKAVPNIVYDSDLQIEGQTNPGINVSINQKEVTVKEDGSFQAQVALSMGVNTIKIEASNYFGDKSTETIVVTRKERITIWLTIGSKTMVVNTHQLVLDAEPFIDKLSGRTMVPLRAISEAIDSVVSFYANEQRIEIQKDTIHIQLWIGKPNAIVNGKEVPIDQGGKVSSVIVKGRTFVPLRFIAETFDFKVDWDQKTQGITLTYPK